MAPEELSELLSVRQTQMDALRVAWTVLTPLFEEMRDAAIQSLVGAESEQVRGRIKALNAVIELPSQVSAELEQLAQHASAHPE